MLTVMATTIRMMSQNMHLGNKTNEISKTRHLFITSQPRIKLIDNNAEEVCSEIHSRNQNGEDDHGNEGMYGDESEDEYEEDDEGS